MQFCKTNKLVMYSSSLLCLTKINFVKYGYEFFFLLISLSAFSFSVLRNDNRKFKFCGNTMKQLYIKKMYQISIEKDKDRSNWVEMVIY